MQNRDIACVYEGYIWNHDTRDVTWTFVENFDDNVYLKIDDTVVLDNGVWNEPTKANITLAPGPHAIHLGVRQGGGGSGPSGQGWMNDNRIGIGIDFEGRDADVVGNYVPLSATAQGGTLPLLTTAPYLPGEQLIPADTPFAISGGAKVDLDGATFTLNNVTSAAGGFENGSLVLDGTWTLDYADVVAGKTLTVSAADLSHTTIAFTGTPVLDRSARYPILVSEEALTGLPTVETELPRGWGVKVRGGTSLNLMYSGGTILYLR